MTMIKILEAPTQNERHKFVSFPNLNGSHQFNLSKEEYWKDPDKFYENIKDEEIRAFLWWVREMC